MVIGRTILHITHLGVFFAIYRTARNHLGYTQDRPASNISRYYYQQSDASTQLCLVRVPYSWQPATFPPPPAASPAPSLQYTSKHITGIVLKLNPTYPTGGVHLSQNIKISGSARVRVSQVKPPNCFRRLEKLVSPSNFDTSFSSLMMWNLQSYPTTLWTKECDILGVWPSYIFSRGSGPPTPRIYAPASDRRSSALIDNNNNNK